MNHIAMWHEGRLLRKEILDNTGWPNSISSILNCIFFNALTSLNLK